MTKHYEMLMYILIKSYWYTSYFWANPFQTLFVFAVAAHFFRVEIGALPLGFFADWAMGQKPGTLLFIPK